MRLSELNTGDRCIIVKVKGHGGFRRRIIEMGFIKGKMVEVLLSAPLTDPVKYRIMGYEISLRRSEADMIEAVSMEEAKNTPLHGHNGHHRKRHEDWSQHLNEHAQKHPLVEKLAEHIYTHQLQHLAHSRRHEINVALVGNPNSGKTSFFNYISGSNEHTGNYGGVTVDAHTGSFDFQGYHFNIVDLPGTYSLSAYSPEEKYVRNHLVEQQPDVVINIIDSTNIERNLYLTTQLIDMNIRFVGALNLYDDFQKSGAILDHLQLSRLLGAPMIPTISRTGEGIEALFHIIIHLYEGADFIGKQGKMDEEVHADLTHWHRTFVDRHTRTRHKFDNTKDYETTARHIHINHGGTVETAINTLRNALSKEDTLRARYSLRYLAIKLLENDTEIETLVNNAEVAALASKAKQNIQHELGEDSETAITNAKYAFIDGALVETWKAPSPQDQRQSTRIIDSIVTHRLLGYPIFILLLWIMFQSTFTLGQYPMDAIEWCVGALSDWLNNVMTDGALKALLIDGVIGGVGGVVVFLPNILILYFFISLFEDSGYMARAAFIMDKIMHKIGLHGKSFIPFVMGFGCNVPAIMATRTIESRSNRLITMLAIPFMTCSARLPIYLLLTGIFFPNHKGLVMLSLYAIGILLAIIFCKVMSRWFITKQELPFVMELPPYRRPTWRNTWRHAVERGKQYLRKMGRFILLASVVIWFLSYYPAPENMQDETQRQEQSYLGQFGKAIEPVLNPIGMNWRLGVSLLAGAGAKEVVAGSLCVLYAAPDTDAENVSVSDAARLSAEMRKDGITPFVAYCFLLFVMIYFPCVGVLAAIHGESGRWRWALFSAVYSTALAYFVTFAVYTLGTCLFSL